MKSEVQLPPTLPNDMIQEILLKLPVKSVLRFKCVCKSWQSIILNPQFAKSHFDIAAESTHRILKVINKCEIKSIDTDVAFDDDPKAVVYNIPLPSHDFKVIAGSCRGFILLKPSAIFTTFIDFLIWNPSTGSVKHIMPTEYNPDTPLCGIGYDSSTDDYLVVVVIGLQRWTKVKYFSLRTNSWSFSKCTTPYDIIYLRHGEFLNGALHWLVRYSYDHHYVIIAFNMSRKRRLLEIPVPQHLASASHCKIYNLRVMNECLCICVKNDTMLEIWMMKEYKVQSSWTKSFVLCSLWRPSDIIYPICLTKYGDILVTDGFGQTLARFNDKGVLLQYCRHGHVMNKSTFHLKYSCMYRESLLSLPRECKDEQLDLVTIGMQRAKRRM